jgi:DNA polymerase-3 subunit epsilon
MSRLEHWPRVIQLAWTVCDVTGTERSWGNYLIKPDGWAIPDPEDPPNFWQKHGFTQERSLAEGVPLAEAAAHFVGDLQSCKYMVSHNMEFDYPVLGAELIRYGLRSERVPARICTKESSTDYCRIPFPGRRDTRPWVTQSWKWPTLDELHRKLFGQPFDAAHDARGDVAALKSCLFELIRRGVIRLDDVPATQRAPRR